MSLFLASRLIARRVLSKTIYKTGTTPFIFTTLKKNYGSPGEKCYKFSPINPLPGETYDDKNYRIGRPLAPHLTIYKTQYTSGLSIIHRITGMIFSALVFGFAICSLVLPENLEYWICRSNVLAHDMNIPTAAVNVLKALMAFPFIYHSINGVRHLLWDLSLFLTMKGVLISGIIMVICVLTVSGLVTASAFPEIQDKLQEAQKEAEKLVKK